MVCKPTLEYVKKEGYVMEKQGFEDYFLNLGYKHSNNLSWLNGWTRAERESRCGWYDEIGRPNSDRNKDKS